MKLRLVCAFCPLSVLLVLFAVVATCIRIVYNVLCGTHRLAHSLTT